MLPEIRPLKTSCAAVALVDDVSGDTSAQVGNIDENFSGVSGYTVDTHTLHVLGSDVSGCGQIQACIVGSC